MDAGEGGSGGLPGGAGYRPEAAQRRENGTVELRTGSLRPHLPEELITKLAPVEFDPVAEASRFMKFLKQTLMDAELIAFVQRFLG